MRLMPVVLGVVTLLGAGSPLAGQAPVRAARLGPQADSTLKTWLRQLVVRQEQYYSEHGTYTTDVAALGLFTRQGQAAPSQKPDSIWVEVIEAGGRSWWGRGMYRGHRDKSCVIWVGTQVDFTAPPATEGEQRRAPQEGAAVCDAF
jgi:hypothetical protein